jgi:hypothetical protein
MGSEPIPCSLSSCQASGMEGLTTERCLVCVTGAGAYLDGIWSGDEVGGVEEVG